MTGIININKPSGKTSHDMVYFMRRLTGVRRVGHTGTLDPDATGVLPVCIGMATKASQYIMEGSKSYRAQMLLGSSTDTYDASGTVTAERNVNVTEKQIIDTVGRFIGQIMQVPPMYSAVKVGGKKLYELARQGKQVARKSRKVEIYKIDILEIDLLANSVLMDIDCSKGTYIRTLINDIGEALGCLAHMGALVRTRSERFTLEKSHTPDELVKLAEQGELGRALIPVDAVFDDCEAVYLSGADEKKVRCGRPVPISGLEENARYRVYAQNGDFLCLSQAKDGFLVMLVSFWQ